MNKYKKYILVFLLGIIETALYTGYILAVGQRDVLTSSLLMTTYMIIYLGIISWAIKDVNSFLMIITYAISCGVGTALRLLLWR